MTTKKILIGFGSLILAVAGVFATKANNKMIGTNAYFTAGGACRLLYANTAFFTDDGTGGLTPATIATAGGGTASLYTAGCSTTGSIVYFTH